MYVCVSACVSVCLVRPFCLKMVQVLARFPINGCLFFFDYEIMIGGTSRLRSLSRLLFFVKIGRWRRAQFMRGRRRSRPRSQMH